MMTGVQWGEEEPHSSSESLPALALDVLDETLRQPAIGAGSYPVIMPTVSEAERQRMMEEGESFYAPEYVDGHTERQRTLSKGVAELMDKALGRVHGSSLASANSESSKSAGSYNGVQSLDEAQSRLLTHPQLPETRDPGSANQGRWVGDGRLLTVQQI